MAPASIRILLVDDYVPIRAVFSRLLSRQSGLLLLGAATSGEEAILLANQHAPDVIVMDAVMPGIGGLEATRRIVSSLPNVRIIGHSANELGAEMRAAGAVDFVLKGSSPSVLFASIREGHVQELR